MTVTVPAGRRSRTKLIWLVPAAGFMILLAPIVLLAGAGNPPCDLGSTAPGGVSTPVGAATGGMFAQPLQMQPGKWYRAGATEYGGPSDPTSSSWGSSGAYLPSEPNSFAELSVLDSNPANTGTFTFGDANALDNLPYGTAVRVANGNRQQVLIKRDVGYGQGPGQTIPYRLDVWWQSAGPLGISKTPVDIQLAPASGTGATLGQVPATPTGSGGAPGDCATSSGPLPLTPGQIAKILPDGDAAAPQDAPRAVKLAIAAGNQIHTKPYPVPDAHFGSLAVIWPAYDCSGSVSYVLYKAGLHSVYPDVSGALMSWGDPGPGKWITVYATNGHTWIVVAGIAFDTSPYYSGPNIPAGSGPRWRSNPTANLADGLQYVTRHPPGL